MPNIVNRCFAMFNHLEGNTSEGKKRYQALISSNLAGYRSI
jgi:hypothetical protein